LALFLYGTLLDPRLFIRFAGRSPLRRAMAATLPGHRRVMLRGTRYPTLLRGPGLVRGVLVPRVAPPALTRLAAYEGAGYALAPVRVDTARGPRRARAWIAPRWRAAPGAAWTPRANVTKRAGSGALCCRPAGGLA
jgi:hypothetical protein